MKGLGGLRATAALVGVAATAALALAGCATADTAAVVNGVVVSEREAQRAAREINEAFSPEPALDTSAAVSSLITAPLINEVALKAGKAESDATARAAMQKVEDPSQAALDLVKANFALQRLDEAERRRVLQALQDARITINPRYGVFNRDAASFEPAERNWIASADQG